MRALSDGDFAVVDPPSAPTLGEDTGEALLASARRAYEELEPAAASALMQRWWQAADAGEWRLVRDVLLDAALLAAETELALGDATHAEPWLRRARAIAPEATLDPTRYSPPFRAAFDATAVPPSVAVAWSALPDGATVRVDGGPERPLADVARLPLGTHWLELRAPGMAPRRQRVDVREGEPLALSWERDPTAALREAAPTLTASQREAASEVGQVPLRVVWSEGRLVVEDGVLGRVTVEAASLDEAWTLALASWARPPVLRRRRALGLGIGAAVLVAVAAVAVAFARGRGDRGWQLSPAR